MITITVTPRAEADLISIWAYSFEQWGSAQADAYIDQLMAGIQQLKDYPSLGMDCAHVLPGYRRLQVEHHAVFYKVIESELRVIRVLHESMDASKRLPEGPTPSP